jgi:hypothetical protein
VLCEKKLRNEGSKVTEYLTVGAEKSKWWQKIPWMYRERINDALDNPSAW